MKSTYNKKLIDYICFTKDRVTSNIVNPYEKELDFQSSENSYFILDEEITQFEKFYSGLFNSLQSSLEICAKDRDVFLDYYSDPRLYEILTHNKFDVFRGIFRHDVLEVNGTLKLLEINGGANIGGWELDMLAPMQLEYLRKANLFSQEVISYRSVVASMIDSLIVQMASLDKEKLSGNIGVFITKMDYININKRNFYASFFDDIYRSSAQYKEGQVHLICEEQSLQISEDGALCFDEIPIDALLMMEHNISRELQEKLLVSHLTKKIFCTDTLLNNLVSDKSTMALLHDIRIFDLQPQSIKQWITQNVPWTIRLDRYLNGCFEHKSSIDIIKNQADFVIKKCRSLQGKDVYIGRFMTAEKWQSLILNIDETQDWIVQQYFESDLLPSIDAELEPISVPFVWGVFDFNGQYGGSLIRSFISSQVNDGVINAANGAVVVTVFEELQIDDQLTLIL